MKTPDGAIPRAEELEERDELLLLICDNLSRVACSFAARYPPIFLTFNSHARHSAVQSLGGYVPMLRRASNIQLQEFKWGFIPISCLHHSGKRHITALYTPTAVVGIPKYLLLRRQSRSEPDITTHAALRSVLEILPVGASELSMILSLIGNLPKLERSQSLYIFRVKYAS